MKQKIVYICEFCNNIYFEKADCENCEASHFGLSRREYLDWRMLNKEVADAGKRYGVFSNENTRNIFDAAIEKLVSFESKHAIKSNCKKPTDFYF